MLGGAACLVLLADSTRLQSQIKTQEVRIEELLQEAATVRSQLQEVSMQPVLTRASPHLALAVFRAQSVTIYTIYTMHTIYIMHTMHTIYTIHTMYKMYTMHTIHTIHTIYTMQTIHTITQCSGVGQITLGL